MLAITTKTVDADILNAAVADGAGKGTAVAAIPTTITIVAITLITVTAIVVVRTDFTRYAIAVARAINVDDAADIQTTTCIHGTAALVFCGTRVV